MIRFYFQTGDTAGILGGLALAVVEVRGNRDHRVGDRLAEILFSGFLRLAQHFRRDLRRRQLLLAHLDPCVAHVLEFHRRPLDLQRLRIPRSISYGTSSVCVASPRRAMCCVRLATARSRVP
jgi:hypothetical protein